jgi:hypothetical protein
MFVILQLNASVRSNCGELLKVQRKKYYLRKKIYLKKMIYLKKRLYDEERFVSPNIIKSASPPFGGLFLIYIFPTTHKYVI